MSGIAGVSIVGVFLLAAAVAPWASPFRPTELAGDSLTPPSGTHLLGTDVVGQDVFSQMVHGAQASVFMALVAGAGTLLVGATIGLLAGWWGGRVDAVLMRLVDLVMTIPRLPLLIVAGAYAGPDLLTIAVIICLTFWPASARVVRSQTMTLRSRAHVRAAGGFGANTRHVLTRHIIPEIGLILAAGFVASAGRAVALEAGLAFLGLGDATRASWGSIIRDALDFGGLFYTAAWSWWLIPPVVAISGLLLGITLLGIAIEQRVNPRLVRHVGGRT